LLQESHDGTMCRTSTDVNMGDEGEMAAEAKKNVRSAAFSLFWEAEIDASWGSGKDN